MTKVKSFFASRCGIITVGGLIGIIAASLQKFGNPGNMGICMACFERDIMGALGLHRAAVVQYLRPEIPAFVFGSLIAALMFKEFKYRSGSSPVTRFFLGMTAMMGALVFLGCPWRALLRLSGGDWNAITGIIGLIVGITVGVLFLKKGFTLGRAYRGDTKFAWIFPFIMAVLLALAIIYPNYGEGAALFRSASGPGSMGAPLAISIGAGLIVGFLAQRTRFCTMGAIRDVILMRDFHLLSGVVALVVTAVVMNLIYGQFHPGFTLGVDEAGAVINQPAAHTNQLLNFGGMVLAGMSFALAGGCPGRQIFLSGEGDADAAIFVIGMMVGAGVAHNFMMVATQTNAPWIVGIGIVAVLIIGFLSIEREK
ncbi:MAG: YedE-related selenium metabolism membrane protein [Deltaproteobacteria bacterium]|uniref:YedE-related selenium metabolism membrane protein n=1 Tax=Candidatus Zymogenus saltonus TaxID=2844893 RepID=A0A9D8KBH2_9DELT|nr:YedE-related selenium metabolism membrane protein [Candidatus Zymogenus saltonus]